MTTPATPTETPPPDPDAQLQASIASLGESIDRANLRLDLTRAALKAALQSDLQYRLVISAIEQAVADGGQCEGWAVVTKGEVT